MTEEPKDHCGLVRVEHIEPCDKWPVSLKLGPMGSFPYSSGMLVNQLSTKKKGKEEKGKGGGRGGVEGGERRGKGEGKGKNP